MSATDAANRVERYGVVGNPIAHSWSPAIHEAFGRETRRPLSYERMLAPIEPAGAFERLVGDFFAAGGRGLNITVPFKERAFRLATELTARAQAAGACNTLKPIAGGVLGDNTDGPGLVADIEGRLGLALAGRHLLLLGAGGAARGVAVPLLDCGLASLTVANRNVDRAELLLSGLPDRLPLKALALSSLTSGPRRVSGGARFDVIVDATAAGLAQPLPTLDASVFDGCQLAYDMVYAAEPTGFLLQARAAGVPRLSDGLGMLVEQAARAFELWHGVAPATAPVYAEVRARVGPGCER